MKKSKESKEKRFNKRLLGAVVGGSLLGASSLYNKRAKAVGTSSSSSNTQQNKKQSPRKTGIQGRVNDGVEGFSQRIHKK